MCSIITEFSYCDVLMGVCACVCAHITYIKDFTPAFRTEAIRFIILKGANNSGADRKWK